MNLAQKKVHRMFQERASILIQRYLRVLVAKYETQRLIDHKILTSKTFVALRLQSHFRRHKAQEYFDVVKKNAKAKLIQSHLKKQLAIRSIQAKLSYKAKIVRI